MVQPDNPILNQDNADNEAARARELASVVASARIGVKQGKQIEMKAGFSDEPPKIAPQPTQTNKDATQPEQVTHNMKDDIAAALKEAVLLETPTVPEKPKLAPEVVIAKSLQEEIQQAVTPRPLTVEMPISQNKPDSLDNKAAVLHTLKQDVEGLVQNRKVSMIRAAALESDKPLMAEDLEKNPAPQSQNSWLMVSAIVIAFLALITIGAVYYSKTIQVEISVEKKTQARYDTSLVFFEHVQPFDITDLESYELRGGLAQLRETIPATLGSITLIDFLQKKYDPSSQSINTQPVDIASLMAVLKPHMPETLLSSLTPEFFFGVHAIEENAPFILFKISSTDRAFAGMLDWEKNIGQDLQPFFESRGVPLGGEILQFSDISIDSIDARVVRGADGNIRIIYAIVEKNILVITNNIQTLREVTDRTHTQVLKKKGVTQE